MSAGFTLSRDGGVVVITRTDAEGQQTITGHNLCAFPGDEQGVVVARLVDAAPQLLAAAHAYVTHLQAVGIPNDDQPYVDALIAAVAKANGSQA